MKDSHLNIFWQYNQDENTNVIENNITRNTLLTFNKMNDSNKIRFINLLIGKTLLNKTNDFSFEIELQCNDFKQSLLKINDDNKFLIGFCPEGKVGDSDSIKDISNLIINSSVDHGAIPDGCILIKHKNTILYAIVFENKLVNLYPEQLKRHFVDYMNVSTKTLSSSYIQNHLIVKSYSAFYEIFKKTNGPLNTELLDYMNIGGNLYPLNFGDLTNMQYNTTRNIEHLLGNTLDLVCNKGKRDRQKGWGEIIDIDSINKYIRMIGLIYDGNENIYLSLRFASTMTKARNFYKDCTINYNKPNFDKYFVAELECNYMYGYIEETRFQIKYIDKYIKYLQNNLNVIKQYTIKDYENIFLPQVFATQGPNFHPLYKLTDKRLQKHKNNTIPSLTFTYTWKLDDLIKTSKTTNDLSKEVINAINLCEQYISKSINY